MKRCQNEMYNTDNVKLPKVKCYGKVSVVRRPGTCWETHICADCANGEKRLTKRALEKWRALGWVEKRKKSN